MPVKLSGNKIDIFNVYIINLLLGKAYSSCK